MRTSLKGRLPTQFVSLIIQAKRPERVDHWRGGQYYYWNGPYFRFYTDREQHSVLADLEAAVTPNAFVRYACGAFIEYDELLWHQVASEVAEHSTFVSPAGLAGHRLWSFRDGGTLGFANPEGEPRESETVDRLLRVARAAARSQTLSEHFVTLAAAVKTFGERPSRAWAELLLRETVGLEGGAVDVAVAWATFASAVARTGAAWLVLGWESAGK